MNSKINLLFQNVIQNLKNNNFTEAKILLLKILDIESQNFDALNQIGVIFGIENNHIKALNFFKKAQKIRPENNLINFNLAKAFSESGNDLEAIKYYKIAIGLDKNHLGSWLNFGQSLYRLKRYNESVSYYDQAIKLKPDFADAYNNKANTLKELKRYDEALLNYDQAIKLKPDFTAAYNNKAVTLYDLKRYDEAIFNYDQAIKLRPDFTAAYNNKAVTLYDLKRYDESLSYYDQAIKLKPDFADAYNNKANTLKELKRYDEALLNYDQAIKLKPDFAEAYNNKGVTFKDLKRYDEALLNYDQAIKLKPDYADTYNNKAATLYDLKRYDEAIFNYDQAIKLKPNYEYLFGMLLIAKNSICDWKDFEANVNSLILQIKENKKCSVNFPVLILVDSLSIQRKSSEIFINDKHPFNISLGLISKYQRKNKIRIGYYSADFHNHATSYLMAELFERHDKTKFELIAFSFGPDQKDEMRQRLSSAFNQFIDVRLKSDKEIALMSREMNIDIAVDLKGFTEFARTGIFAHRAAPIQANYIGYPGMMAAKYIDYIIADRTIIPIKSRQYYSEKVVYLPNSYQVNDRKRVVSKKVFKREELGLPKEGFVFCCFNNNFKITPHTFDGWMRILKAVEGSVLWLLEDNATARINLRKEAQNRGINPIRLLFAKRMEPSEHLARQRAADLFIDTLPYNAHTTTSDALWIGLPVLTCKGESFASRVAASLLNAIELPELITDTQEQYESVAIDLATNPAKFKAIKDKLERNKMTTALFDTARFTKHIESAYTQMYERYQTDLPPDDIYIEN